MIFWWSVKYYDWNNIFNKHIISLKRGIFRVTDFCKKKKSFLVVFKLFFFIYVKLHNFWGVEMGVFKLPLGFCGNDAVLYFIVSVVNGLPRNQIKTGKCIHHLVFWDCFKQSAADSFNMRSSDRLAKRKSYHDWKRAITERLTSYYKPSPYTSQSNITSNSNSAVSKL